MFKSLLIVFSLLISGVSVSGYSVQPKANKPASSAPFAELSIIPEPDTIVAQQGYFEFSKDTKILEGDSNAAIAGESLNRLLDERYGVKLGVTEHSTRSNTVTFVLDQSQGEEGYTLKIDPRSIQITGTARGMFYGIQSLLQLFPANFNGETRIPSAVIRDSPRFRYRGMHLDVARHFLPVEFVKKFISLISRYKYNYFHWHLTDDQGWRIEIKKYPRLTVVGSKRRETVLGLNFPRVHLPPDPYRGYVGDNQPVEGFYTQEEIREVVRHAKERSVTVIPEIEMPGHASAALASYPELGCLPNYRYQVQTTWGAFPDIFCPTEPTFRFIQDVLSEVIDLFPDSPYVHIGGGEVLKMGQWTSSKTGKEIMRANQLSTGKDVQRWFLNRIEQFVNSKGKTIIGWDDMMDVGMPSNATVMASRMKGDPGVTWDPGGVAAKMNHDVIMTPNHFTHFDHLQGDGDQGRLTIYNEIIPLEKVYHLEPIPVGLSAEEARHIIGGEGTLWTEFMKTPSDIELMMFPRTLALAEVLWSKSANRNLADFRKRLATERPKLDRYRANNRVASASASKFVGSDSVAISRPRIPPVAPRPRVIPLRGELNVPGLEGRNLPFTVVLPSDYRASGRNYAVLYLLHGLGGTEKDWWDRTSLERQVENRSLIVVMPGTGDTWSPKSGGEVDARYEDALVNFLLPYISKTYRVIPGREGRAVVGNSTGGLGAIKLALRYPREFAFAGSISGTFDNDAFQLLEQTSDGSILPWLYLSWGWHSSPPEVAESNRRFKRILEERGSRYSYFDKPYENDWSFWNREIGEALGAMCLLRKIGCP